MGTSWSALAVTLSLAVPAEIAFTSGRNLSSVKADGSAPAPLVQAPRGESVDDAAWSPDGTRLVFGQGTEDGSRLMLEDAGGTRELAPLRAGVSDAWPAWSPDGTAIVFARISITEESLSTQLVVHTVATGAERVLLTQDAGNRFSAVTTPAFSPDGATIAYTFSRYDRNVDNLPDIRTIPVQGGPARTLIRRAQGPSFSPDGTRIAYASIADRNGQRCGSDTCAFAGELYVANADGTQPRRLTKDLGGVSIPRWSPDGSRILFSSDRNLPEGSSDELYTIAPDGSCLTWLTNGVPGASNPAWRPGSGDSYSASCNASARRVTYTPPKTTRYRGNLWLGAKRGGLLLTGVQSRVLYYDDCERFRGCPAEVVLTAGNPCRREYTSQYRLSVRRGLLVADLQGDTHPLIFGGALATLAPPQAVKHLRALRRQKPRIPRSFLAPLGAAQKAKLKPYRVC